MSENDKTHPVVNCVIDGQQGEKCPVVIRDFKLEDMNDKDFTAIYCPGCQLVLNIGANIEVEWYDEDELEEATGWKVAGRVRTDANDHSRDS